MKKWIAVLLAALMLLPLIAACQLTETDEPDASEAPGETELDLTAVVATVGEETITLGEVKTLFDSYVEYFSYYGYDVTSDEETLHQFQDDLVNQLVEEKLVAFKAKQLGYDKLSDEQQTELDARVEEELAAMADYYREQAQEEYAADNTIDVDARTQELILEEAAYKMSKDGATFEEYAAYIQEDLLGVYLAELVKEGELGEVSVTAEVVESAYQTQLSSDTAAYGEDPASYLVAQETYESTLQGLPVLYVPEGYSRVYDIFIPFEASLPEEYDTNEQTMKTLKAEYQELSFADAVAGKTDNAARMAQILTEYAALKSANDAFFVEYEAAAKVKIDDLYAQLQSGADFKELMLANTQNEGFIDNELFANNGMLITTKYETDDAWGDATKEAFNALAVGEYSAPVAGSDGYHIIFYIGDEPAGARANEGDVHSAIEAQALASAIDTEWTALLEEWKNGDDITINVDTYRVLGKTTEAVG